MLVKLGHGASVNPENLKHISIEAKRLAGKMTYVVQIKLDDNSIHPVAYFREKKEALELVADCVKKINDAE